MKEIKAKEIKSNKIVQLQTEGLQVSVKGPSTTSLTYDKNGNLMGDGTNSYKWDAADRMIEIDYPGTGNKSLFAYDGLGRNIQILEYSGGSLTSTTNFVWDGDDRSECRDSTASVMAQYFPDGEVSNSASYFWTRDWVGLSPPTAMSFIGLVPGDSRMANQTAIGSIREMTDATGAIEGQVTYDLWGGCHLLQGTLDPDFEYSGYYRHGQSGLLFTRMRFYSNMQGRFMNRDPIAELGGNNLYSYCFCNPVGHQDPSGLDGGSMIYGPQNWLTPQSQGTIGQAIVDGTDAFFGSLCPYINIVRRLHFLNLPAWPEPHTGIPCPTRCPWQPAPPSPPAPPPPKWPGTPPWFPETPRDFGPNDNQIA